VAKKRDNRPLDDQPAGEIARRRRAVSGQVERYEQEDPFDDPGMPLREDIERFGDVTMKCHECGAELFDDVDMCYNCGAAVGVGATESKLPLWVVVTVVLVLVGFGVMYVF
jgi:hypothetical protein